MTKATLSCLPIPSRWRTSAGMVTWPWPVTTDTISFIAPSRVMGKPEGKGTLSPPYPIADRGCQPRLWTIRLSVHFAADQLDQVGDVRLAAHALQLHVVLHLLA